MAKTTHTHVLRNGQVHVVKEPKGSLNDTAVIRENMLGVAAKALLKRAAGRK